MEGLTIETYPSHPTPTRVAITPNQRYQTDYGATEEQVLSPSDAELAYQFAQRIPDYQPTPLIPIPDLATNARVSEVVIKHEGYRSPTKSFKVLGPPFALAQQLLTRLKDDERSFSKLWSGELRPKLSEMVACAATSGNHGRALAWAASRFGCRCKIFMPEATGVYREEQIRGFGAETIRVPGTYDSSVVRAQQESAKHGYLLVGDGAPPTGEVLRHIVHGYSVVGRELSEQMDSQPPTHVLIPAGSGSLSAGIVAQLWMKWGIQRPRIVVVQSHAADACYQSCLRNERCPSQGDLVTLMDGLSVREVSPYAWSLLSSGAFAAITIDDAWALAALRFLSKNELAIGETGLAALAALLALADDASARERLGIGPKSRVVVVATEGVTDPGVFQELLGQAGRPGTA